ncbi:hypothetical protein V8F33_012040 [Rhypophila sp. PSN 637]
METTFLSLNEDVQRLILQFLPAKSLSALCLVHPTIHHLAEEFLYSEINLVWGMRPWAETMPNVTWIHPLIPLLRTLLCRPGLASLIKSISCIRKISVSGRDEEIGRHGYLTLPDPPLDSAIALVGTQTSLPYRDIWVEQLEAGRIDAYLGLLFTQLPHLKHLQLEPNVFMESELLKAVLSSLHCPSNHLLVVSFALPGTLRNLETVQLSKPRRGYRRNYLTIQNTNNACDLLFSHAPSIKELTLSLDAMEVQNIWTGAGIPAPPTSCTSLAKLELQGLREAHLARLFCLSPRLQSFAWEWSWNGSAEHRPCNSPTIALNLLIPVLHQVKDTLTELNIHDTIINRYEAIYENLRTRGSSRGLASLSALKRMTIPFFFLTGLENPFEEVDKMAVASSPPPNLEVPALRN